MIQQLFLCTVHLHAVHLHAVYLYAVDLHPVYVHAAYVHAVYVDVVYEDGHCHHSPRAIARCQNRIVSRGHHGDVVEHSARTWW